MGYFESLDKFVSLRLTAKSALLAALLGTLTACGGGGDSAGSGLVSTPAPAPAPAPVVPPAPETVTGVAIPSNVSVVTANNAS